MYGQKQIIPLGVALILMACATESTISRSLSSMAEKFIPHEIVALPLSAGTDEIPDLSDVTVSLPLPTPAPRRENRVPKLAIQSEIELAPWVNQQKRENVDPRETAQRLVNEGIAKVKESKAEESITSFRKARLIDSKFLSGWLYEIAVLKALGQNVEKRRVLYKLKLSHPDLASRLPNDLLH